MEKRTAGAWILHHTKKIQEVNFSYQFDEIKLAGKCGLFLANLAATNEESLLTSDKVNAIANANNISKGLELPVIKETLRKAKLIDISAEGDINVLGFTTSHVLDHTSDIFTNSTNDPFQRASLELSNYISDKPVREGELKEFIADTYQLDEKNNNILFELSEEISLLDYEYLDGEKTYFNGNLFKREDLEKTTKVLSSLKTEEANKVSELDEKISNEGCVLYDEAYAILGENLIAKLQAIGMYDFNEVSNTQHAKFFLTKPSAFSKFGNPFEVDALDMAKAFISSLYYGMKMSSSGRGRIQDQIMLFNTVNKLLRGENVGPCTAIGEDYRILEVNRVIKLIPSTGGRYYMRLLKFDIGKLALDVLQRGDNAHSVTTASFESSSITSYTGPESNRLKIRKKKDTSSKKDIGELLRTIRG